MGFSIFAVEVNITGFSQQPNKLTNDNYYFIYLKYI